MPRFGQAERENHMTGQYQGFTQRERAPNRVLTADIGSAHVLCPYSYSGTSLICVIATAQSVGHSVACLKVAVPRRWMQVVGGCGGEEELLQAAKLSHDCAARQCSEAADRPCT